MLHKKISRKFYVSFLCFLLVVSNLYKFRLMPLGYLNEPDETLYFWSWSALKRLFNFDVSGFVNSLFSARGRPLEVLIKTIPASFQFVTAKLFHLNFFETKNMYVLFVFNMLIYVLILYYLYKLALLIFKSKFYALFSILSYSVLINSYAYLRHIYPYDTSLLFLVYLLYRLVKSYINKEKPGYKQSFFFGVIAAFSFLIYPTFYMAFFALFFVFLGIHFNLIKSHLRKFIWLSASYVAGSTITFALTEFLSRLVHTSYVGNLTNLSQTITQGDYDESFYYLFKYFYEVEGSIGWAYMLGLAGFILLMSIYKNKQKNESILHIIFLSFSLMYFFHTGLGYFGHKMTVYIRQMHQFMPILAIFMVYAIWKLKISDPIKKFSVLLLSLVFFVTYFFQMNAFFEIAYPKDVYWTYLRHLKKENIHEIFEYEDSWSDLPSRFLDEVDKTNAEDTITAVNTCIVFPVDDIRKYHAYMPKKNAVLIYKKPHYLNCKAYQFEGYNTKERQVLDSIDLQIRLYK